MKDNKLKNKISHFLHEKKLKDYILFWLSGSISQLGSSMTSFALIIWAYKQTGSAMTVSLLTFFSYVPFIIISLFAGVYVDRHKKKSILLCTDLFAFICSVVIFGLLYLNKLEVKHIYIINFITGAMNAFQSIATTVTVGLLVPKDKYGKISGMNSFTNSLLTVVTPMLAAFVSSFWGLKGVLFLDMLTFLFAFGVLLLFIRIPEYIGEINKKDSIFKGFREGLDFLKQHKGIWAIIISMAWMNFLSRLTYENILSPMILARSGGDNNVLGIVTGTIGFGGIVGGLIVTTVKLPNNKRKLIYISAALSFLLGDVIMGSGRNVVLWCFGALAASVPIPFIGAGQSTILYRTIPSEIQGRVFAVRNAVQYFSIPIGTLLGGFLADYIFEPFMLRDNSVSRFLHQIVGKGTGSGMALMFMCTGVLGCLTSLYWYNNKDIKELFK